MRVFVSYRREDNPWVAGRLRDRLVETYAASDVFFDVDDIPFGVDFRDVIRSTLRDVDVVLAIIGAGWNPERLSSENDFVRVELLEALQQKKRLIPVLIGDTPMPKPDVLPGELEPLAYLNATRLRPDPDFTGDAARLVASLGSAGDHDSVEESFADVAGRPRDEKRAQHEYKEAPEQGAASTAATLSKRPEVRHGARLVVGLTLAVSVVLLAVAGILIFRSDPPNSSSSGPAGMKVFTKGPNPVIVYSGPSDQPDEYQAKASLDPKTPVFLRCSLFGSPVGEHNNPLWYFVESRRAGSRAKGWVSDHWLLTGTSRSLTSLCLGNPANPTVGSGPP